MTLSLPKRIFLVHLVFMLALGSLSLLLVKRAFDGYRAKWESQQQTLLTQNLFSPLVNEVARSLLLKVETGPQESQEEHRRAFRGAMNEVLPTLPSIERLFILDPEFRVQYAYEPGGSGLAFADGDYTARLASDVPVRRQITRPSGETSRPRGFSLHRPNIHLYKRLQFAFLLKHRLADQSELHCFLYET